MNRVRRSVIFVLLFPLLLSVGCATTAAPAVVGPAADTPDRFLVIEGDLSRPARASEGCRNPMVDPRDGTRLTLIRSASGQGDYSVPTGRYGVSDGALLRLNCATGEVVGVVSRSD